MPKPKSEYREIIKQVTDEVALLRNVVRKGGSRRMITKFRCGIPPRKAVASPFVHNPSEAVELGYWRSIATRKDMEDKLMKYLDYKHTFCADEIAVRCRSMVKEAFKNKLGTQKINPLSYSQAFRAVPQDTSPGFPWTRVGIYQKRDCKMVFERLRYVEKNLFNPKFEFCPCVAQARRPLCPRGENKPRLVWAYPMEMTMIECTFAVPLIAMLKETPYFAWSYNWLDGYAQIHYDNMQKGHGIKCGADWKGFDAEISPQDIKWAFDILKEYVVFKDKRTRRRWDIMVKYFIETPILFYDNLVLVNGGIPSGSFFTQLVGSILNMYYSSYMFLTLSRMRTYIEFETFDELFPYAVFLGDDTSVSVGFSGYTHDRKVITDIAKKKLNKVLHPEKGFFYSQRLAGEMEFEFLGKTISSRNECTVPADLALAQVIYPEDPDDDPGNVLTRCIGVLWMAGTDKLCDTVIRAVWDLVKMHYPDAQPTPFKKDLRDVFKYMLNISAPTLTLPTRQVLLQRYICR